MINTRTLFLPPPPHPLSTLTFHALRELAVFAWLVGGGAEARATGGGEVSSSTFAMFAFPGKSGNGAADRTTEVLDSDSMTSQDGCVHVKLQGSSGTFLKYKEKEQEH